MNKSAIYIHVPWCRRRCPYCDFYLVVGKPKNNFIDALMIEWETRRCEGQRGRATSLYFGGGTPSLLDPREINRLINYFFDQGALIGDAEITIEANPEDLDGDYAARLADTAVNRVSLGAQSFDDDILRILGRKHKRATVELAVDNLLKAGQANISVDLILGVVGEKKALTLASLGYLSEHAIPHVSAYLLTIEERTNFFKRIRDGQMDEPKEDEQVESYRQVQSELKRLGYLQYDISSYAKPGYFSRHNQVYWAAGNYIGLGPGAHSMRLLPDGGIERAHNRATLSAWLKDPKSHQSFAIDRLTAAAALLESLSFGLRNMGAGIRPSALAERHQAPLPPAVFSVIEKLKSFGWLDENDGVLRITEHGALFADAIMRDILCC